MDVIYNADILDPLLISDNCLPSKARRYSLKLAEDLTERVAPEIAEDGNVLFVFILRGAMLLYPPFAEKFDSASFTYVTAGTFTELNRKDYDTAVIVDSVVDSGKTAVTTKKLLSDSGITAKRWFCACVLAKAGAKEKIDECFDRFFYLVLPEEFSNWIDAGEYAACGDKALNKPE